MALVVCPQFPEECLLLGQATFLNFIDWITLIVLGLIWWIVKSSYSSGWIHLAILFLRASPSHNFKRASILSIFFEFFDKNFSVDEARWMTSSFHMIINNFMKKVRNILYII